MPFEGEKLDELLSGLLDDQLSAAELQLVEQAIRSDASLRRRLDDLRQSRQDVAELGRLLTAHSQSNRTQSDRTQSDRQPIFRKSMAAAVIAQARQQAEQMGLPPDHHVFGRETARKLVTARSAGAHWRHRSLWIGTAVTAAALLLAIGLTARVQWGTAVPVANSTNPPAPPGGVAEPDSSQQAPQPTAPLVAESSADQSQVGPESVARTVGQFGQLSYVLVVDVQMTTEGLQKRVLEDVLAGAGIPQSEPVLANSNILVALEQSRMIVDPKSKSAEQIYLTVVRADMQDIDAALQNIWKDNQHFPRVSLNIAIDARAALVREILNSTAGKYTLSDSFAVPVAAEVQSPQVAATAMTPFPGAGTGVNYISSHRRADGWGASDSLDVASSESLATILLVTHLVD